MKPSKEFWSSLWKVIEFVLTLGLSHIVKHKRNSSSEGSEKVDR